MAKIGNILKENGISVQKITNKKGELIDLNLIRNKTTIPVTKEVPYVSLKAHWKIVDREAQEEIHKAINAGCDPDYILKSSKEMGKREPNFEMTNGMFKFVKSA